MTNLNDEVQNALARLDEKQTRRLITAGIIGFVFVALSSLILVIFYVRNFGRSLSTDRDDWGVFGDFLGGVLNPVVGIVTIYLVLMNLIIQRKELRNSLREMRSSNLSLRKQNAAIELQHFQNTFFNWFNSYQSIVKNIEITSPSGFPNYKGYAALTHIHKFRINTEGHLYSLLDLLHFTQREIFSTESRVEDPDVANKFENSVLDRWKAMKREREDFFEGGFRTLLHMIDWIVSQPEHIVDVSKKAECFRIIRSQLTNAERVFLLYESWKMEPSMQNIIKKYNLVSALNETDDVILKFMLHRAKHLK